MRPRNAAKPILSPVNPAARGWGDLARFSRPLTSQAVACLTTPSGPGCGGMNRNGIEQIDSQGGASLSSSNMTNTRTCKAAERP